MEIELIHIYINLIVVIKHYHLSHGGQIITSITFYATILYNKYKNYKKE